MRRRPTARPLVRPLAGIALALTLGLASLAAAALAGPTATATASLRPVAAAASHATKHPRATPRKRKPVAPQTPMQKAIHPSTLYFGVAAPGLPWGTTALVGFGNTVRKTPNLVQSYQSFGDSFPVPQLKALACHGELPMITWEPWDNTTGNPNPYPLRSIAAGTYDAYLRTQAALVRSVGCPVAIRLAPEMNGDWYPWGQRNSYHNSGADFVAMWRHVHDIFAEAGTRNAIWVWSPNVASARPLVPLESVYPGSNYVDIVGLVGYLDVPSAARGFAFMYDSSLSQLNVFARNKPILVTETGVSPSVAQTALLQGLIHGILTTPRMIGFVWFDYAKTEAFQADWRLEDNPRLAAVFRGLIANKRFAGHQH